MLLYLYLQKSATFKKYYYGVSYIPPKWLDYLIQNKTAFLESKVFKYD